MGTSNKVCPNCGRKMKQQFIGLQHCRCGMSWKKDIGFFERTPDMGYRQVLCANSFTSLAEQSLHKAGNLPLITQ